MVAANVGWVTVEDLTHLEDTRGWTELSPEVLWHLWDGVDSDSIESEFGHKVLDPVLELASNPVILLLEIWKVGKSAVLDLPLVSEIGDLASWMVMISGVEWADLPEVLANWGNMVGDDVNHHVDVSLVASVDETLEVILRTESIVDLVPVTGPVSVVSLVEVVDDWSNPDGVEAHSLDVIEMVLETFPGSTAVVAEVGASTVVGVFLGESVGEDLVDSSLLPVGDVTSRRCSEKSSGGDSDFAKHIC